MHEITKTQTIFLLIKQTMKPILSLTLSFLILAFITNLSSNNAAEPVLDINGISLIPGNQYYIFPATDANPKSGGLRLNKVDEQECPVTVIQNDAITGLPVTFTLPEDSSASEILTNTSVDVEFIKTPNCAQNDYGGKWNIFYRATWSPIQKNNNKFIVNYYVGIGGPNNYLNRIDGTLSIHEYGSPYIYKFVFCDDTDYCEGIGRTEFNSTEGGSRLLLTESDPYYQVVFVDAALLKSGKLMSVAGNLKMIL